MTTMRLTSARVLTLRIFALALMLAGLGLIATTELGLIHRRAAVQRHGGMVEAGTDGPQAGMYGQMIRVAGPLQVVESPRDDDFNLSAPVPVLTRHVEMFQWREVAVGGTVHYEMDWVDHPVDSHRFVRPQGHANRHAFPIEGRQFDAGLVRVGKFALGPRLLHAIPGEQPVAPDTAHLPANLAASFTRYGNYLVTSAHPASPRLGDVRVSWSAVPAQPISVFARLEGSRLVPAADGNGPGFELQLGQRTASDLLPDVPPATPRPTVRRILAVSLGAIGAFVLLLVGGHPRHDAVLALATATAMIGAVAGVLWLGSDWRTVLGWFALVAAAVIVAIWRLQVSRFDAVAQKET